MEAKICQSCGMPMVRSSDHGTESSGFFSQDYCKHCYFNGMFVDNVTMEEYIEMCTHFADEAGMTAEQMHEHCKNLFPTLKRWKNQ